VLVASTALVVHVGQPGWAGLRVPSSPSSWADWLAANGAVPAAVAIVRVVTVAVGLQLALVLVAAAVTRSVRWRPPLGLLRALSVPGSRRLVDLVVGISVLSMSVPAAGAAVGPARAAVAAAGRTTTTTTVTPATGAATAAASDGAAAGPDVEVIVLDGGSTDAPPAGPEPRAAEAPLPEPAAPPEPTAPPAPTTPAGAGDSGAPGAHDVWEVRPGEHFWSIAEQVLATSWSRPPTDSEVASYWSSLVERNRSRLAHPADPDLVFAGQLMELPPVPPAPAAAA
jgi:hypothetical protein